MTKNDQALNYLKLLAHDVRWQVVLTLMNTDLRVNELVSQLGQPTNLVSYHLKQLRDGGLVSARRSTADGRDIYYSLNRDALYTGLGDVRQVIASKRPRITREPLRVLFICAHNSARSQIAEGIMNALSDGRVQAFSAGPTPAPIKPEAIQAAWEMNVDISQQQTKTIGDFLDVSMDYVITVCDEAREICPTFKNASHHLHWGISSPSRAKPAENRLQAYQNTARYLYRRIDEFLTSIQTEDVA